MSPTTYFLTKKGSCCPIPTGSRNRTLRARGPHRLPRMQRPQPGDAAPGLVRRRATEFLAGELGVAAASLGCPRPGMMYAQVLTPGYLVAIRDAGMAERRVHTNEDGSSAIVCDN